ncbi:hypothetical protein BV898_17981 [Hypsibius exemplaris]|uniref:Uncharacterized protein n=1 Tax=Hypsibius exemplaris TaxID=2072580 RepID=A0A9X6NJ77_HYPEX|nr:hypothetical protein BV898_17981 [Hypsibius exemplaris]
MGSSRPTANEFVPLPLSLQLTGFLVNSQPAHTRTFCGHLRHWMTTAVGLTLIAGALADLALRTAQMTYRVVHPELGAVYLDSTGKSGLLDIMEMMPYFILNFRGIVVLIFAFWKRDSLHLLSLATEELLKITFSSSYFSSKPFRKFKSLSIVFLIATATLHVVWECFDWVDYFTTVPNATLYSSNYLNPIPTQVYPWEYICVYSALNVFPFILSQHVYIGAVVFSWLLSKSIQTLKHELLHTIEVTSSGSKVYHSSDHFTLMTEQLRRWEKILLQANCVARRINHSYGWVFLATHVFDALNMLCLSSWIVSISETLGQYAFALGSVVAFGVYAIVFPIPMVMVAEEEAGIWRDRMLRFESLCWNHSCILSAVTVEFTRGNLVGIWTFVFSFVLVAKEFLV